MTLAALLGAMDCFLLFYCLAYAATFALTASHLVRKARATSSELG
jgi:hypothetical protein